MAVRRCPSCRNLVDVETGECPVCGNSYARALAGRITRWDFGEKIQTKSSDEVGELARAFNTMATDLKGVIQEKYGEAARRAAAGAARTGCCGTGCGSFEVTCPHTVFHASAESARAWLAGHDGLDAQILDQATAIECGRFNCGPLLTGPA